MSDDDCTCGPAEVVVEALGWESLERSKRRSRILDDHVTQGVVAAWEQQKAADEALRTQFLKAIAAGRSDEADALEPRVHAMLLRWQGKPTTESSQERTESAPIPSVQVDQVVEEVKPNETKHRITIAKDTSVEQILQTLQRELEALQTHTYSPSQRLGVESAIRLIQRGVTVK